MNTCYDEDVSTWTLNGGTDYTFGCRNGYGLVVNHVTGNVLIVDTFFGIDSLNNSITSSANSGSLIITGGTTQQLTGTYGNVTKTGLCQGGLGTLVHEETALTWNGTRLDSGLHGNQVYVHNATPGYTRRTSTAYISQDSLNAHLLGISDKFVELQSITPVLSQLAFDLTSGTDTEIITSTSSRTGTLEIEFTATFKATTSDSVFASITVSFLVGGTSQYSQTIQIPRSGTGTTNGDTKIVKAYLSATLGDDIAINITANETGITIPANSNTRLVIK